MNYIKDGTTYPYNPRSLKSEFPNVSFPKPTPDSVLADYGVYPVADTAQPPYDPATQNIAEGFPADAGGNSWSQTWDVTAKTQQEQDDYAKQQQRGQNYTEVSQDAAVQQLLNSTPAEIDAEIDLVTSVPQLKEYVRVVAKAVAVTSQQNGLAT